MMPCICAAKMIRQCKALLNMDVTAGKDWGTEQPKKAHLTSREEMVCAGAGQGPEERDLVELEAPSEYASSVGGEGRHHQVSSPATISYRRRGLRTGHSRAPAGYQALVQRNQERGSGSKVMVEVLMKVLDAVSRQLGRPLVYAAKQLVHTQRARNDDNMHIYSIVTEASANIYRHRPSHEMPDSLLASLGGSCKNGAGLTAWDSMTARR